MYKYSVVIPCYNDANYVGNAVNSVLDQKSGEYDVEVIVVDDGTPNDSCFDVLKSCIHEDLIIYVKQENMGLSAARNTGVRHANGDYIIFLDSDDLLACNYIFALDSFLKNLDLIVPDLIVSPHMYFCDEVQFSGLVNRKRYSFLQPLVFGKTVNKILISTGNCFPVSACAVSNSLFQKLGGFDEDLRSLEDWDFWIRAIFAECAVAYNTKFDNSYTSIRIRNGMMMNGELMKKNIAKVMAKHKIPIIPYILESVFLFRLLRLSHAFLYFIARFFLGVSTKVNSKKSA